MIRKNILMFICVCVIAATPLAKAESLYWLANKMVKKNIDVISLFNNVPKGSIIAVLPKYAPQVCDYKSQITEYKNKLYIVTSCVYIGYVRKLN